MGVSYQSGVCVGAGRKPAFGNSYNTFIFLVLEKYTVK